jgi:molybdate transport system regulatory protein
MGVTDFDLTLRINLKGGKRLGPGKVMLLEEIDKHGSISAAGRAMNMSYKRAWDLVSESNSLFGVDVVESKTGGKQGGGANLTPFGLAVIKHYRAAEKSSEKAVVHAMKELINLSRLKR